MKKKTPPQQMNADKAALLACMDKIMEGDCSCVKIMLDQVSSQSRAIEEMSSSGQEPGDSIMNIQESASTIRDSSKDIMNTTSLNISCHRPNYASSFVWHSQKTLRELYRTKTDTNT